MPEMDRGADQDHQLCAVHIPVGGPAIVPGEQEYRRARVAPGADQRNGLLICKALRRNTLQRPLTTPGRPISLSSAGLSRDNHEAIRLKFSPWPPGQALRHQQPLIEHAGDEGMPRIRLATNQNQSSAGTAPC